MSFSYNYPRPAVTVDIVVIRVTENTKQILLIQRLNPPFQDAWAIPGGFMDMDETLEQAALRELEEETGIKDIDIKQFKAYSDVSRDPRGRTISVVFTGQVSPNIIVQAGDDAKKARWFDIDKLPNLAFDHQKILRELLIITSQQERN